jgi:hypothetical protein
MDRPKTIQEAVRGVIFQLTETDHATIRSDRMKKGVFIRTMAPAVRGSMQLWARESAVVRDASAKYKIAYPDDIAGLIVSWVWAIVRGEDFDPVSHCEIYHRHWKEAGTTSLKAGGIYDRR